mmetsp:Transcript_3137/g.7997  ORF Transcript_3137/g.7997 Transcript_3137/m.7997 type:complete len:84 (+) Transcript_3137:1509-1760(+)
MIYVGDIGFIMEISMYGLTNKVVCRCRLDRFMTPIFLAWLRRRGSGIRGSTQVAVCLSCENVSNSAVDGSEGDEWIMMNDPTS